MATTEAGGIGSEYVQFKIHYPATSGARDSEQEDFPAFDLLQ